MCIRDSNRDKRFSNLPKRHSVKTDRRFEVRFFLYLIRVTKQKPTVFVLFFELRRLLTHKNSSPPTWGPAPRTLYHFVKHLSSCTSRYCAVFAVPIGARRQVLSEVVECAVFAVPSGARRQVLSEVVERPRGRAPGRSGRVLVNEKSPQLKE